MTIAIIVSVFAGMAIGLRFRIFMVAPAILVAGLSTAAIALAHDAHFWPVMTSVILSAIGLQIGYLCGSFAFSLKEMTVAEKTPAASVDAYQTHKGISVL
jgi:hypothetical protein